MAERERFFWLTSGGPRPEVKKIPEEVQATPSQKDAMLRPRPAWLVAIEEELKQRKRKNKRSYFEEMGVGPLDAPDGNMEE